MGKTTIIAEIGVNHNGDIELAKKLIDQAVLANADVVKFQTFKAERLASQSAQKAAYQVTNTNKTESQQEMLKALELSFNDFKVLADYSKANSIEFLSTAFDKESLDFLVQEIGLKTLKIASGELTNAPLLLQHAKTGCDMIVSTGMATLEDIEQALSIIAFGYLNDTESPGINAFKKIYASAEAKQVLHDKVKLLHCTTQYPAPFEDINLRAMDTLKENFNLNVGYSDHSEGILVAIAAVARGATLIEKHFTLDTSMEGPDHRASLNPAQLKQMIDSIRAVELVLGDGVKAPRPSELGNINIARKSLIASDDIRQGEQFSPDNIDTKRPGHGVSPGHYWDYLSRSAKRAYSKGDMLVD